MKYIKADFWKLHTKNPCWIEYLIPAVLWGIWLILYSYIDTNSLTIWSTTLLDSLVDGRIYEFYEVVHENAHGLYHEYCGFNFIALIPWAIWNVPIWAIQRFAHIEILNHTWMLLYSKLFLLALVAVVVVYADKIVAHFEKREDYRKWNTYLILTYPFVFIGVILAGQSDIVAIALAVIAVYELLQDKQGRFLVLMSLSIAAKPFFIFAYIAVILMIEKHLLKAVLKIAAGGVVLLGFHLIYYQAPGYLESLSAGTGNAIIEFAIKSSISANNGYQASSFMILLVVIYFAAYLIRYDKTQEKQKYIIYMMVAPMGAYFCFATYEFYRMIYLAPFMMILMTIHRPIYRLNLILENVISIVGTMLMMAFSYFFAAVEFINPNVMNTLGLAREVSECHYDSLFMLFRYKVAEIDTYLNIGAAVFVAAFGIFLVINIPAVMKRLPAQEQHHERWLYWLNTAVLYGLMALLMMCYFQVF